MRTDMINPGSPEKKSQNKANRSAKGLAQDVVMADWLGVENSKIVDLGPIIGGVQVFGPKTRAAFQSCLLTWYDKNRRILPWREERSVYGTWISEIMLQQTQVKTVIPYYERFMAALPDVATLARVDEAELLKLWQGLGYYSRAKNLRLAAQQIVSTYGGEFPRTYEGLLNLKGIGPYTAQAICSMAYNLPYIAIDGNALRVLSRLFAITLDIGSTQTKSVFEEIGNYIISQERPGDFNQALMDLGASFEGKKPEDPKHNPIRRFSLASLTGRQSAYPIKVKRAKIKRYTYQAWLLENEAGEFLLVRRPASGLLASLWTFPLQIVEESKCCPQRLPGDLFNLISAQAYDRVAEEKATYPKSSAPIYELGQVKHQFTHQTWQVAIYYSRVKREDMVEYFRGTEQDNAIWLKPVDFKKLPSPTVQEKIWQAALAAFGEGE